MSAWVVLCVVIGFVAQDAGVLGLECYQCSYFKMESDTPGLSQILTLVSAASDDHCRFLQGEEDKKEVGRFFCDDPDEDEEAKCVNTNGIVHGSIDVLGFFGLDFKYRTIARDCAIVKKADNVGNGCYEDLPANSVVRTFFQEQLKGSDFKFDGKTCYTSGDASNRSDGPRAGWPVIVLLSVLCLVKSLWR